MIIGFAGAGIRTGQVSKKMDHLIGLVGKDFALVAADRKVAHSIIAVKNDEDKILALDHHKLLACGGELGLCNSRSD